MNICCTMKLLKELAVKNAEKVTAEDPFLSWHANLLKIERRKCVLITNDKTLYSIFLPGLLKKDFANLAHIIKESIFRNLIYERLDQKYLEAVLQTTEPLTYHKTFSRSVLGSMNDFAFQIDFHISQYGGLHEIPVYEMNSKLNRVPMGALGYKSPINKLQIELQARVSGK